MPKKTKSNLSITKSAYRVRVWIAIAVALMLLVLALAAAVSYLFVVDRRNRSFFERFYVETVFDAASSMSSVERGLSKLAVSNSNTNSAEIAREIWRQSTQAAAALSRLPKGADIERTHKFFLQVGDFAYGYSERLTRGGGIGQDDIALIKELHATSESVVDELLNLQSSILAGERIFGGLLPGYMLRDSPLSARLGEAQKEGLKFPQVIYDGIYSDCAECAYRWLDGLCIVLEDDIAALISLPLESLGITGLSLIGQTERFFEVLGYRDDVEVYVLASKHGGKIVSIISRVDAASAVLDEESAKIAAISAANILGYDVDTPIWYSISGGRAIIDIARAEGDIVFYTDVVKVTVALNNGNIVAFDGRTYCRNHHIREYSPTMNEQAALSMIAPHLRVNSIRLCVVAIANSDERLTYEVVVELDGMLFRVYLDAHNGEELMLKRIIDSSQARMV